MPQKAPTLLNADGSASMATALMMSHHGFRRDIALIVNALARLAAGDRAASAALQEDWKGFHAKLHGHHEAEDHGMFPNLKQQHPEVGSVIDGLTSDHRRMDPLLERGERAYAELPAKEAAVSIAAELSALLDPHLATEEAHLIPFLREAKAFPPPANDGEAAMYAEGFAWSSFGIAPEVLERVDETLSDALKSRLPAARAAFAETFRRRWGNGAAGTSRTSIPDWLPGGG